MTTIEDVLTYIDGSNANGRLVVAWKPFTVGNVNAAGGELEWPIVDGAVSISLYANTGALPTGSYYVAKYELENGAVYLEQWVVPNLPTVNLGQVRVSFPPSPSVMISPLQLTSLGATPGMFLMWDGQRWVPGYPSTFNLDPNWIGVAVGSSGNDISVTNSQVHLGNSFTINIPDAGPAARGVVTTSPQSFGGVKTFLNTVQISTSIQFALRAVSPGYGELLGFGTGGADSSLAFGGNIYASRVSPVDRPYMRADHFIGSNLDLETFGDPPTAVMPGSLANPARTLAALLLPVAGTVDWTGIGTDTAGALWLRTGTSTAAGFLYLDTAGNVTAREFRMDPYQHLNAPGVEAARSDATMVMYSGASDWAGYGVNSTPEIWFRMGPNASGAYYYFGAGGARFPGNLTVGNIVVTGGVTLPAGTYVPTSRRINTSTGLTGGGPLTADLTLSVVDDTTTQRVEAAAAGVLKAVRHRMNFIAGTGQLITVVDNAGSNQTDITITNSASGSPSPSIYSIDGAVIGTRSQLNLITGTNITLLGVDNSGLGRVDITIGVAGSGGGLVDPTTTKGDIIARGATAPATRLGVGADAQVLTADSASPLGLKWTAQAGGVPPTRLIIAGTGLGGGGSLAADVTLTANVVSVNGQTGAVVLTAANVGGVPTTRQVIAGTGLTGGGPLSSDVTLAVVNDTVTERVRISNAGTLIGTRQQINFIQGANISLTVADVPGSNWVGVTVAATTSGLSDPTTTKGDLIVRPVGPPATRMGVGATDGMVLTVDSTDATFGIKWKTVPAGFVDPTVAKGDLIARGTTGPATNLGVGANGQVLTADSAQALGVKWAVVPASPQTPWLQDIDGAGFTLKNAGKVGINVSAPYTQLHLRGAGAAAGVTAPFSAAVVAFLESSGDTYLELAAPSTNSPGLLFSQGKNLTSYFVDNSGGLGILAVNGQPIYFATGASTERMRITSAGNVGIGTTSPGFVLTVNGDITAAPSAGGAIRLAAGAGGVNYIQSGAAASPSSTQDLSIGPFQSVTSYLMIKASGNVGIGTTSPIGRLSVVSAGTWVPQSTVGMSGIGMVVSGSYGGGIGMIDGANMLAMWGQGGDFYFGNGTTSGALTGRMIIAATGNVGIGPSPIPSATLELAEATQPKLGFYSTGGNANQQRGALVYDGGQNTTGGGWTFQRRTDAGGFAANLVTIIASTGRVGILTTSPGFSLDVAGDVNCSSRFMRNGGACGTPSGQYVNTGARALGTVYQNTNGIPIFVNVTAFIVAGQYMQFLTDAGNPPATVNSVASNAGSNSATLTASAWVMPNHYYKIFNSSGSSTLTTWIEWI